MEEGEQERKENKYENDILVVSFTKPSESNITNILSVIIVLISRKLRILIDRIRFGVNRGRRGRRR